MNSQIPAELRYPVSWETVSRKRRALRKELLGQPDLLPVRIAILGGSTTTEIASILELFLLAQGIRPSFYESEYNAYYEDVLFENPRLWTFRPDIVFVHTTWQNVSRFPDLLTTVEAVEELTAAEISRFEALWAKIQSGLGALIVQNNFDLPRLRPLGNLEASAPYARQNFLLRLNAEFARCANRGSRLLINDIHYLSARVGLEQWFDSNYWYYYKMALSPAATVAIAQNVAAIVKSVYGKNRKCLVLDLDNTLWGGVIGEDGLNGLILGRDHPVGEAFLAFQNYVKDLRARGVLLAVCSKNDVSNAREGFSHPDSVLKLDDFSAFKANWNPKPDNLQEIAAELNIGLDSLVFIDDNPAERAIVAAQTPEVATPEIGPDVAKYPEALDREAYFEPVRIVPDDLERAAYYTANVQRAASQTRFESYGDFLDSLEMTAEIGPFLPLYRERITQLINKTNQFNLTTRRYTAAEVEAVACDPSAIALCGRLVDKFGDNGLVSVLIAATKDGTADIRLWLMSCRVLKREMEYAMFDALVSECLERGIRRILGTYIPSKKNGMVAGHYRDLGFTDIGPREPEGALWQWQIPEIWRPVTRHIRVSTPVLAEAANA
jgi:FkbH-like protein